MVDLLTDEALDQVFASLADAKRILVAVSGGPDSVALLHLLAHWKHRPPLAAATVDHRLRPESATEADAVAAQAARLGIPHAVLSWADSKPMAGLQEAARDARYSLLTRHAGEIGASHLTTAHTMNDQAETVLMRMASGSGLTGLAGMRRERNLDGIIHVRPLLGVEKRELVEYCTRHGLAYVTDPSNASDRFTRVRWRKAMPALAAEGLTAARLAALADRLARADEALDIRAQEVRRAMQEPDATLRTSFLRDEPLEISLRVIQRLLTETAGTNRPLRLARIEAAVARLIAASQRGDALRLSLGGSILNLSSEGSLAVRAEGPRKRGR
jgi:tRNA(Ile)-lysidine synthase